jgi:hypothetical protein
MSLALKSVIALFVFAFVGVAGAAPHVEHIARFNISDFGETEYAPVFSCATENDRMSHIKLRVSKDPARIDSLVVWFGNGEKKRINVRDHFAVNSESRWINLPGGDRCVKYIKIKGEATGAAFGRSTIIDVFGLVTK